MNTEKVHARQLIPGLSVARQGLCTSKELLKPRRTDCGEPGVRITWENGDVTTFPRYANVSILSSTALWDDKLLEWRIDHG